MFLSILVEHYRINGEGSIQLFELLSEAMASLEDLPLLPPPQGQSSNFDNPETRGPAIVAVCSVFLSLMWPIFLLRLYSKLRIVRAPGWDDGKPDFPCLTSTDGSSIRHTCSGKYLPSKTLKKDDLI